MMKISFPKLKFFIPIRAVGLKQFRKYSNGPNCEKAIKCLVDYDIKGFQDVVRKAVAAGENINKITSNCDTLYTCIAKLNNPYLLEKLLEAAGPGVVDFNAPNLYGETFKVIIEEEKQEVKTLAAEVMQQDREIVLESQQEVIVAKQENVEDDAQQSIQEEKQVDHVVEQYDVEEAMTTEVEDNREMALDIGQEVQVEDITLASESFGIALFNKLAVLNDQPPVLNDEYVDNISVVAEILPMTGQVEMIGDQVESISDHPVEKLYQKSLIFGSHF